MKKAIISTVLCMACIVVSLLVATMARAEDKKLEVKQVSTMAEVLGTLAGTSVDLTLRSGTNLSGKVGAVQQNLMVLAELRGKEFYDAVVRIEDISAVSVRVRSK